MSTWELVRDGIATLAAVLAILAFFGIKPQAADGGVAMPLSRRWKLAIMLILVAASWGLSIHSFYRSRHPRIVEKTVEKPVEKIVEKFTQIPCPKVAVPTLRGSSKNGTEASQPPIKQDCGGGNCAASVGQSGGVTAGSINIGTVEQRIPEDKKAELINVLSQIRGKVAVFIYSGANVKFAQDWDGVLRAAGWNVGPIGESFLPTGRVITGIRILAPEVDYKQYLHQTRSISRIDLFAGTPVGEILKAADILQVNVHMVDITKPAVVENDRIILFVGTDDDKPK
ncbi:MAG: hypothetical protein ACLP6G_23570 [Terriglobales bacterium]